MITALNHSREDSQDTEGQDKISEIDLLGDLNKEMDGNDPEKKREEHTRQGMHRKRKFIIIGRNIA